MKILYIGKKIIDVKGGADLINRRNLKLLKYIVSDLCLDSIAQVDKKAFFIYRWGGDGDFLKALKKQILQNKYDYVFLSQSLYGDTAQCIKKVNPNIKIICFFHNIEKQYAKEYMKSSGAIHYPFYYNVKLSEKKAVLNSDYYIVLNERDASLLKSYYGKEASLILPTSFEDTFQSERSVRAKVVNASDIIYLFVGGAFFANVEAVRWFIKEVLPYVPGKFIVVGKGMDAYYNEWHSDRIEIHGFVNDLSDFYYKATLVVSPIFSGGGMKTKTAEALMYGKTILGTKEAFEGYKLEKSAMILCDNSKDFISNILNLINLNCLSPYNAEARKLFLENYSLETSKFKMSHFFNSIIA